MANEYLKPQIPLKDLNSENYFYPLTTLDQIIIGNSRLSAYFSEDNGKLIFNNIDGDSVGGSINLDGIIANRTLFVENDSLLSSENIFINNDSLAINKTSITDGYKFEVNGVSGISDTIKHNHENDAAILQNYYNSTWYNLIRNHNNGNISISASSSGLYLGYENTTFINFLNGRARLQDGCLHLHPNNGNYREGIRIHAQGSWSDIVLGGNDLTGDTGTSANTWFIGNNDGTFNIVRNGSSTGTAYFRCVNNKWYANTTSGNEQLNVGGWVGTVGNVGWYNITHGGGWYMSDTTWIRTYGNKSIYQNTGKIRTDGEMWSKYIRIVDNWIGVYENIDNTTKRFGYMQIDRSNNGWFRFAKEQGGGFLFTGGSVRCDSGFRVEGNNQGLYMKSTGFPTGTPSATTYFEPLNMYDNGNNRIGTIGCGWETSGRRFTHIQCQRLIGSTTHYTQIFMRIDGSGNRRVDASAPIYGAVWNDYAEFRKGQIDNLKPGQVVTEIGNGEMKLANKKLQKGCKILSDTFGFAIGETKECKLPIAVSGRVLVYCDTPKEELEPGDCLCANYNGNAIKMTQGEIINYPDRIIGTVSEIPNYEIWHGGEYRPEIKNNPEDIQVDGRIWVYVR